MPHSAAIDSAATPDALAATRQVALLRGINVGKAKRIAMADLRAMFQALGLGPARTLLNSGNVVFEGGGASPADNARRIAGALHAHTGVSANVLALSAAALDAAAAGNPFLARMDDPARMLVCFIADGADRAPLRALVDAAAPGEHLALGEDALYLWCPDGILASATADRLVGARFRELITSRNWSTVGKLQVMVRA